MLFSRIFIVSFFYIRIFDSARIYFNVNEVGIQLSFPQMAS